MENHVVFPAVDNYLAFVGRQPIPQSPRTLDRCEAAADDYDLRVIHFDHR
jgi:hypothetical protein